MKRPAGSLALIAAFAATQLSAAAQPALRHARRLVPPVTHESRFYIKGPNAPFQNQLRKMTDPLNANGAGG